MADFCGGRSGHFPLTADTAARKYLHMDTFDRIVSRITASGGKKVCRQGSSVSLLQQCMR